MDKFKFRLETLLKVRKSLEEQAQIKFNDAVTYLGQQQEILQILQTDMVKIIREFHTCQQQVITVDYLKIFRDYIDKIEKDINDQKTKVSVAEGIKDECLFELENAARNRKLIERLREKRLDEYRLELLHEEAKFLDDIATQKFMRNRQV